MSTTSLSQMLYVVTSDNKGFRIQSPWELDSPQQCEDVFANIRNWVKERYPDCLIVEDVYNDFESQYAVWMHGIIAEGRVINFGDGGDVPDEIEDTILFESGEIRITLNKYGSSVESVCIDEVELEFPLLTVPDEVQASWYVEPNN